MCWRCSRTTLHTCDELCKLGSRNRSSIYSQSIKEDCFVLVKLEKEGKALGTCFWERFDQVTSDPGSG